jgi:hypothetical protein
MEELRLKIIEDCNNSGLPLEAILFVVRDVYRDVSETFQSMKEQKETSEE